MTETKPTADPALGKYMCATPCNYCPFLSKFDAEDGDRKFLRSGRRIEFLNSMLNGADFPCHKTAEIDEDDEDSSGEFVRVADSLHCAGARLVLERASMSSNTMRFEERLDTYHAEAFIARNAKVRLWTYSDCVDEGIDDDIEPCSVVGPYCSAPAGTIEGGGVVRGTVAAENYCTECGQLVCDECVDEDGMCNDCVENDEDF
jgi:hypothetical protein